MIKRLYEGQVIRFISEEHKQQWLHCLGLGTKSAAYIRIMKAMNQPEIRIDATIDGTADKINGITMTYNPILESDFVYFEEVGESECEKLVRKIREAYQAGKENEILELSLKNIIDTEI
ncbi:hypothetical protein phiAS5_ORF0074 [Aeromonas phage phiAS5]|uniref:Uncharacterized protein n=1 Tax=Aeromonas phage phiAS5 TaxID=879630 RepID=E1A2H1_9CAUD|nr:hypothetical protein phiAS5_ORF0074 [Aeromonas phage phiAS5]ADM79917.1 hypothetical protein phiAS5_ORF0074 [Aeromonas phage phiAS5]BES53312.1 hypothetical protein [Aeromonas phage phiWae14]